MARCSGDVGCRLRVLVIAEAAFGRTRVALIGSNFGSDDPARHIKPSRAVQHSSDFDLHRDRCDYDRYGCFTGISNPWFATTSHSAPGIVACGRRALVHECFGVRPVVLEAGRRRPADAGGKTRTPGKLISFSANVGRRWRRSVLVAPLPGLSVSRI